MKLFILFVAAAIILLAANPSKSPNTSGENDSAPPNCNKNKCIEKENSVEPDDFSLFQFSPFNI